MTPDFLEQLDLPNALELVEGGTADPSHVGRFAVARRLGAGASGIVYLATDPALGRQVALKVLAPALARNAAAVGRFAAEARAAGALEHPRIVPVHEIGRDGDAVYIAMAYRDGVTLRERLRDGALPVADAVRIATEVADGLAAAHAAGIVHRDIKPENILLSAHGACLLDFGIAKIAGQTLTMTGATLGTPAYMSPEQTRGEAVDARTDLWSLGVVLHEMLAGERPFRGEGSDAVVYGIRYDTPPPLPRAVPPHVRRAVARCLARRPAARPQSAAEVIAALAGAPARRAPRAAPAALLALVIAAGAWAVRREPAAGAPASTMVALVPFTADSAAPPPEYLASGLFDELRTTLDAALPRRLIASGSVAEALRHGDDLPAVARRLEAGTLVTGAVRRRADSVELALAVHAPDGTPRWTGRVVRPFAATADLPHAAGALVLATLGEPAPPAPPRPVDPVAHDLLLRARFAAARTNDYARNQAATLAAEAIARDAAYAPAHLQLALQLQQRADERDRPRIRALAERALALDSTFSLAWNVLGQIVAFEDHDWARGEAMLERAVALGSGEWGNHAALAVVRLAAGRPGEALAGALRARETDPLSRSMWTLLGVTLLMARQPDAAIGAVRQGMVPGSDPTFRSNILGRALLATGRTEEAIEWLRNEGSHFAGFEQRAILGHALGRAGRTAEARAIAAQYETRAAGGAADPADVAVIHVGLGDTARALDWLERAPSRAATKFYHVDPIWDPLRGSPRFGAVIRRYGLVPPGDTTR